MPTFPTYDGELPSCLNPWNPRHYLLVLYWVYFRPTALKCYLYQADPELYRSEGGWEDGEKGLKSCEYYSLIIISFLLAFSIAIPISYLSYFLSASIGCLEVRDFNPLSTICLDLSTILKSYHWINIFHWILKNFYTISQNVSVGAILGIILSLTIGLTSGISLGVLISPTVSIPLAIITGSILGAIKFTAFSMTVEAVGSLVLEPVFSLSLGLACGILMSIGDFILIGSKLIFLYNLLTVILGMFRIPSYLLKISHYVFFKLFFKKNIIYWNYFSLFPFPESDRFLLIHLENDLQNGLKFIANTMFNAFQRWAIYNAFWSYLKKSSSPISVIYSCAVASELSQYIQTPILSSQWTNYVSARVVFFAELSGITLMADGRISSQRVDYVQALTKPLRQKPLETLHEIIILFLFNLIELEELEDSRKISEKLNHSTVHLDESLDDYPYGLEVRESLNTISNYLQFRTSHDIGTASDYLIWLNSDADVLRPIVIKSLKILESIGQEISKSTTISGRRNELEALALASHQLKKLNIYVKKRIPKAFPEHKLLLRIISQWLVIINQSFESLGLYSPVFIANPYVAGNPVTGKLFVGRDDILQRIEELWTQPDQLSSIVLYGHRRMGKTSILRNLPGRFGPHTHIIDFNLQRVGMIDTLPDLIYRLAIELHDALPPKLQTHIPEPTEDQYYNTHNPTTQLDRLLKQIQTHRESNRFIIAIDEFEILEDLITQGKIEPTLIAYLRALIQTYPWFILIFAGLHTLQEMTENYWNPLFGSVTRIPVSTLSPAAARELITNPTDDFPLDYDPDAIDRIIQLSGGQPYLTQLLCQSLITRFNRIRFEERHEIEPRFTLQDVETIVANPDFYRDGNAYFSALWDQATETHAPTQHHILRTLAQRPLTLPEITDRIPNTNLIPALQTLTDHDVIALENDRYTYRVELLRLWVTHTQRST